MSWKGWDANTINLQEERIEELEGINAEMLEALEWALPRLCDDGPDCPVSEHRAMFDAIAKAKGGD